MYYRLKDEFRLRGWELLPTGIVRRLSGDVDFLPPAVYRALQKACGSLPVGSVLFSAEERKMLAELCEAGILESSVTSPIPIATSTPSIGRSPATATAAAAIAICRRRRARKRI